MNQTGKTHTDLSVLSRKELEQQYIKLQTEYASVLAKIEWYQEQYRLARQRAYGRSSEQGIAGQMSLDEFMLFNEAEAFREPINIEPKSEELLARPKKAKKRKDFSGLKVVEEVFELTAEEQVCPKCGSPLHEMREEVHVEIEVIPAQVQVHKYTSKVYACRSCEKEGSATIITAPGAPAPLIPRSCASPSLLADIISKKYVDATPFYRQEQNYRRQQIPITRNNLCNWTIRVANDYFSPLVKKMRMIQYAEGVIHCDETYVQVLSEPGRPAGSKSYIWVTTTAECQKDHPIALYRYTPTRSLADARSVLRGYEGYIMCDGYAVYDALHKRSYHGEDALKVTPVACLVHVRRKFAEALKLIKPADRKNTSAQKAVDMIANLFHIDNQFNECSTDERLKQRQKYLAKPLDDFFAWLKVEEQDALPQSHYGKAIAYALDQEEKVLRVLEDGRLELDNSLAERTVKPFVIGRKNWMFADTVQGADASCILYSIVETAKLNGLIPFEYIRYVLEEMRGIRQTDENIIRLLPWSKTIPDYVKAPAK